MRVVNILIAEDERLIRAGVRKMLEDFFAGRPETLYAILEAGNGSDAFRKCMAESVDILITDIRMPAMTGISLAKRVLREGPPMHILAISGYQDYEYVREMMKLGVYDYLIKPIKQKQLWEAMEYFVTHLGPTQAPKAGGGGEADSGPVSPGEEFFDLPDPRLPADFRLPEELARLEVAVLGGEDSAPLRESVGALFSHYQMEGVAADSIKKDLSDLLYRLMQRSPDAIEFISKSRFSRFDLVENFSAYKTLSGLMGHTADSLSHLWSRLGQRRRSQGDATIAKAIAYIEGNYGSDLQLQDVADHVHLNPNYLSTLFKQKTGVTFREYLRKVRIDSAKEQIRDGGAAGEIAELVGYGDTAHFFRAFKNVTGMTPKTYRKFIGRK